MINFRFIKGFILRKSPPCEENQIFIGHMRYNYLMRLKANLPKTVLDKSWPRPPELLQTVSGYCILIDRWDCWV